MAFPHWVLGQPQCSSWAVRSTTGPDSRAYTSMAYDSVRGRVVMFAGQLNVADTWEWNGAVSSWSLRSTAGPGLRSRHSLAFDDSHAQTVLFGGLTPSGGPGLADTWAWDGSVWTQLNPSSAPSARWGHAMVYDSQRHVVALFGGVVSNEPILSANDTWEWDGTTWTQRFPAIVPPVRFGHAIAYDSTRNRTVMFGGTVDGFALYSDTWEWDGNNWTNTGASGPAGRVYHAASYDSARGAVVLFGGSYRPDSALAIDDTWAWDGTAWTQLFPSTVPLARLGHGMAYDSGRSRLVCFGGFSTGYGNTPAETWEFQGTSDLAITAQQAAQSLYAGQRATFFVTATGTGPLTYQWRKDGTNVANGLRIGGSTSPALTIDNVGSADAGNYDCVVTGPCGLLASTPSALSLSCYANCDNSTNPPILNINDFICFQGRFAAGCP
jgi:hypothetical protein